ncbi:hypothetical protein DPMN_145815 [Dreissena polymorpha]|uniref:Uncharacterized protein n=1 Tax=Dreissena polymorpha TaxID=45954 RepID=A0A9D4IXW2_DREPO|nr:hypothetical protein DPMN_145815 [Dreissena polymorpha]
MSPRGPPQRYPLFPSPVWDREDDTHIEPLSPLGPPRRNPVIPSSVWDRHDASQ